MATNPETNAAAPNPVFMIAPTAMARPPISVTTRAIWKILDCNPPKSSLIY